MGILDWLFGSNDNKSSQRGPHYYERQAYMKKLQQARKRWADSQKEAYRTGGTRAIGLSAEIDGDTDLSTSDTSSGVDNEQEEFEDVVNELSETEEELHADIEQYRIDKEDIISRYSQNE